MLTRVTSKAPLLLSVKLLLKILKLQLINIRIQRARVGREQVERQ